MQRLEKHVAAVQNLKSLGAQASIIHVSAEGDSSVEIKVEQWVSSQIGFSGLRKFPTKYSDIILREYYKMVIYLSLFPESKFFAKAL